MIGRISAGEADIALGAMTITADRSRIVDFASMYYDDKVTVFSNAEPSIRDAEFTSLLKNFTPLAWLGLGLMYWVFAMALWASRVLTGESLHPEEDSEQFTVWNGLALGLVTLIQKTYDIQPLSLATRILYLVICLTSFLVYATYSAVLTSFMTVDPLSYPIQRFSDFLEQRDQQLVVYENVVDFEIMVHSSPESIMNQIYEKTVKNNPGASYTNVEGIINAVLNNDNYYLFSTVTGKKSWL